MLKESELKLSNPNVLERRTMEIEVYDTYATSEKGTKIHFDVMLPIGGNEGELRIMLKIL